MAGSKSGGRCFLRGAAGGALLTRGSAANLQAGSRRLEAWVESAGTSMGVHYVDMLKE